MPRATQATNAGPTNAGPTNAGPTNAGATHAGPTADAGLRPDAGTRGNAGPTDPADRTNAGPADLATQANALFAQAIAGPREQLGERLFRMSLTAWENPALRPQLLQKISSATTGEEGAAQLRDHFTALFVDRVGEVVPAPRLRLNAVVAQIVGLIMLRYVMRMEPIASVSVDELVDTFAPTVQRHLDTAQDPSGPGPTPSTPQIPGD